MASYLIWLKSRILLPEDVSLTGEEQINPAQELREMLLAYRAIKTASYELAGRPMLYRDKFPKGATLKERDVSSATFGSLLQAIDAIRARTKQLVVNITPMRFSIQQIMARIQGLFANRARIMLRDAAPSGDRTEIIGTLMAALEMSRLSIANLVQRRLFSVIYLVRRVRKE